MRPRFEGEGVAQPSLDWLAWRLCLFPVVVDRGSSPVTAAPRVS
jgi:hypothetical protein